MIESLKIFNIIQAQPGTEVKDMCCYCLDPMLNQVAATGVYQFNVHHCEFCDDEVYDTEQDPPLLIRRP